MIAFKDFLPRRVGSGGFLSLGNAYETIDKSLITVNQWLASHPVHVLNIETVIIPNVLQNASGSVVAGTHTSENGADWYQTIRVWYDDRS